MTLPIVLGTALVDSINPCAIGVILFLTSAMLKISSDKTKMLRLGLVYIGTVYVVYLLSGLGLVWFQSTLIEKGLAEIVGLVVGGLVILLGLIEIKEFFWYGKGVSLEIAPRFKQKLATMADRASFIGIISIGGFAALVELPCTGGPYLAITALLAKSFDATATVYLLIYNFIFVLPLIVILLVVYFGTSTLKLKKWRQDQRRWMNLGMGILMISLGVLLILYYRLGWHL